METKSNSILNEDLCSSSSIAKRMSDFLDEKRIGNIESSKDLHVNKSTLSDLVNGKTKEIRASIVARFCLKYHQSAEWILLGRTPESRLLTDGRSNTTIVSTNSTIQGDHDNMATEGATINQVNDSSFNFGGTRTINNGIIPRAYNKDVAELSLQISELQSQLDAARADADARLHAQASDYDARLAAKDATIAEQTQQLSRLTSTVDRLTSALLQYISPSSFLTSKPTSL